MTTPKKKISLFSLDRSFYWESNTTMGMLYTVGEKNRYDWGEVELALEQGYSVSIRPANEKEKLWAYEMLKEIKNRRK